MLAKKDGAGGSKKDGEGNYTRARVIVSRYSYDCKALSIPNQNVSENCQKNQSDGFLTISFRVNVSLRLYKCIRNVSLDSFLTVICPECFLEMFHKFFRNESEKCQKCYF